MAVFLQNRFLDSIQSLNRFMELTGVRLVPFDSPNTWKKYFYKLWSVIFLIICVQSNIFIVMKRSCLLYRFISCPQWFDNFIGEFTKTTVSIFLSILKSIDDILKQPSLIRLKQFSLFGLIYLLITGYLNLYFNFFWELFHPVRPFHWFDSIQNGIRVFGNQWFTALPTWIFFLCGQLVLVYFKSIQNHLNYLIINSSNVTDKKIVVRDILNTLRCMKRLNSAVDFLHLRFSTMLLATCFITGITLLSSAYYTLSGPSKLWGSYWDLTDVIDSLIRFWLLGSISDGMRQAVSNCSPILREIRDTFIGNDTSLSIHHKITLFIIEAAAIEKDVNRRSLYGIFPLTKHLTLKVSEIVVTFLIFMFQFE